MIRMKFGFTVYAVVGNAQLVRGGPPIADIAAASYLGGGVPGVLLERDYFTQDAASAAGKSWLRQYQSSGVDAAMAVVGKPVGVGAAAPVRALQGTEDNAFIYERVDTLAKGLRQAINLANTEQIAGGAGLDADKAPDVPQAI